MGDVSFEIESRSLLSGRKAFHETGAYEQLKGTIHLAVDPENPRNEIITDLNLAPRDAEGLVRCSADFLVLKPVDLRRGNHRIFFDVLNRGGNQALRFFNRAPPVSNPRASLELGDGFLMRSGYTVAWCGWQHDVLSAKGLMSIKVPHAATPEGSISGKIMVKMQPDVPSRVQILSRHHHQMIHPPYPTNDLDGPEATLVERENEDAPQQLIPRDRWSFARLEDEQLVPDPGYIHLSSGFVPGKVYQLIYGTTNPAVVGLGLLVIRDLVSFLRYGTAEGGNPCAGDIMHAYAFGSSQSGRLLRELLYLGLNEDEQGRDVFDGAISHIAGARRGEFNQRFGQPSNAEKESVGSLFPFLDAEQSDTETGRTDGLLSRLTARGKLPKVLYTNTATEYWRGDASLIHTDVEGKRDVDPPDNVRVYLFGGTQHVPGIWPMTNQSPFDDLHTQRPFNTVDYSPLLRALLSAAGPMGDFGRGASHQPISSHRRSHGSSACSNSPGLRRDSWRQLPGFIYDTLNGSTLDREGEAGIVTTLPPIAGRVYPNLVSAVDEDGNENAGVRLPEITVPLATYTGWNLRHPDTGGPEQYVRLLGSIIPFPDTKAAREASGDPRRSIEERYASKDDYLRQVRKAAQALSDEGFLLAEDLELTVKAAWSAIRRV